MYMNKPNNKLKELRIKKGLSVYDLRDKLNVAHTTIVNIEKGKTKSPNIDLAFKLAEILDTDVYTLFYDSEYDKSEKPKTNKLKFKLILAIEAYFDRLVNNKFKEKIDVPLSENDEYKKYRNEVNSIKDGLIDTLIEYKIVTKSEIADLWEEMTRSS